MLQRRHMLLHLLMNSYLLKNCEELKFYTRREVKKTSPLEDTTLTPSFWL